MDEEQKQRILNRKPAEERARSLEQVQPLGEGPSKGKGTDPRNWGGADIDSSELDIEAQRAALRAWREASEWAKDSPHYHLSEMSGRDTPEIEINDLVQQAVKETEARIAQQYEDQIQT